jgi:hypothetical protein
VEGPHLDRPSGERGIARRYPLHRRPSPTRTITPGGRPVADHVYGARPPEPTDTPCEQGTPNEQSVKKPS